jgi:hypothetical protein
MEEHSDRQRNFLFDKQKIDLFLKYLSNVLKLISYQNDIEADYRNFTSTLSTSINNFSIEVLHKRKNSPTSTWYNHECKISINTIRDASNASLKSNKISRYKTLIKQKKIKQKYYIHRKKENPFHLFKIDPNKF